MYASDLKHRDVSLEDKLNALYALNRGKAMDLGFRPPYLELLKKFGNPHLNLPPVIHVAGTNGKGSIIATLKSILEESGYRVHAYTSPHLCDFNERIYLAGEYINDSMLHDLIDEAVALNDGHEITFFEITTAMAFAAFSRVKADILLLEVGLGGRLDCTNIIENPLVTIINSIGYDHREILGDTLSDIALEKSGIMKKNVPCVIGAQHKKNNEAMNVFEKTAKEKNAPLLRFDSEWSADNKNNALHFVFKDKGKTFPLPNLQGPHQIYNAGATLAALRTLQDRFPVSDAAIKTGLQKIIWPARLQNLTPHFVLPEDWELWLDGGHNEDAAQMLALQAENWQKQDGKPLHLIMGMLQNKNPEDFTRPLKPFLHSIHTVNITGEPRAFSALEIKNRLETQFPDLPIAAHVDYNAALTSVLKSYESGRILIAGSLYLAGHVLKNTRRQAHNAPHG